MDFYGSLFEEEKPETKAKQSPAEKTSSKALPKRAIAVRKGFVPRSVLKANATSASKPVLSSATSTAKLEPKAIVSGEELDKKANIVYSLPSAVKEPAKSSDEVASNSQASQAPEAKKEQEATEPKTEEKEEDEADALPPWVRPPIETLTLIEMKRGIVLGRINLGKKQRYVIGRESSEVDVLMHHPSIGRKHCTIVHGTPPGTKPEYRHSATLVDLNTSNGTYYKKNMASEKRFKLEPGSGVVLREGMVLVFGSSSRSYEVSGIKTTGSESSRTAVKAKGSARQSVADFKMNMLNNGKMTQQALTKLNVDGAGLLKRKGEHVFTNQAGDRADFESRKRARVAHGVNMHRALQKRKEMLGKDPWFDKE